MRNTPGWMNHKLESRLLGEIPITSDMQITIIAENEEELKSLLKVKKESEKPGSKLSIHKTKIMASSPTTSWQIDGETMEAVTDFIFLGLKIIVDGNCSHEIKRCLLLGRKAMTNLDIIFKKQRYHFAYKGLYNQTIVFPVVMYGCESWTIKKADYKELMLLNHGVGGDP